MSQVEVDKIIPQSGTTLTIGDSGDTITVASGATLTGDLNADNLTSGTVPLARISGAYTGITQTGTLTNSGAPVSTFNRTTNDGTIIDLRKDGTTVGLISSLSSIVTRITFDPRTNGASLTGGANKLSPGNENGATNNTLDLGSSTSAFKDLYLGGGLYVGGTGTANKLDDYEEGTWTSSFSSAANASSLILSRAKYIKVGNKVTLFGRIEGSITSTATETRWELIMPFNAYSNDYAASGAISIFVGSFSQDRVANGVMLNGSGDASKIVFYFSGTNIVKSGAFTAGDFTLTYESA
jgi:hypothetical protein